MNRDSLQIATPTSSTSMTEKPHSLGLPLKQFISMKGLFAVILAALPFSLVGCKSEPTKEELLAGLSEEDRIALQNPMFNTPFLTEGISSPQFTTPVGARIRNTDLVIGLVVNNRPRAYPLVTLSTMLGHVVNDTRLGEDGQPQPFTVTYCDMTDCIRVLEPEEAVDGDFLEINTLGLLEGGLALQWQGKPYKQSDELVGLRDMQYEKMTWGEWKAAHPDTLIYTGRSSRRE